MADKPSVYQSLADEAGLSDKKMPRRMRAEMVERMAKLRDEDATPTPQPRHNIPANVSTKVLTDEIDVVKNKNRLSKTISLGGQCAPLVVGEGVQRQVVV